MLSFAVEYRAAIDRMTADRTTNLRSYEMLEDDWELVKQLRDILKVSYLVSSQI